MAEISQLTSKEGNNFNLIRLVAAAGVLVTHSYSLLGKPENDPLALLSHGFLSFSRLGVYVFFIISGFLIALSLDRSKSLVSFFWKRGLRIFPALIVVVTLSVFLLGPIFTNLNLKDYFSRYETYRYFGGATLYRITYNLPGVFVSNPYPKAVNGSLWTLPYEFTFYILLALLGSFLKSRKRVIFFGLFFILILLKIFSGNFLNSKTIPVLLLNAKYFLNYFIFFMSGVLAYVYKENIKFKSSWLILLSILFAVSCFWSVQEYLFFFLLTYIILWLATIKLPGRNFFSRNDYSYGLYIYAFPVGQILANLFASKLEVWSLALLSLLCALPFAFLSWNFIEKPILKLKSLYD